MKTIYLLKRKSDYTSKIDDGFVGQSIEECKNFIEKENFEKDVLWYWVIYKLDMTNKYNDSNIIEKIYPLNTNIDIMDKHMIVAKKHQNDAENIFKFLNSKINTSVGKMKVTYCFPDYVDTYISRIEQGIYF